MKTINADLNSKKIGNLNETETKQLKELLSKIAGIKEDTEKAEELSESEKMVKSVLSDNYQMHFVIAVDKKGNLIQTQSMPDGLLAKAINDLCVKDQELAAVITAGVMKFLADKPGALKATIESTIAHLEVK